MLFPNECLHRQSTIEYSYYEYLFPMNLGECTMLVPSPDGKYLAYSFPTCLDNGLCGEAVNVLAEYSDTPITIQINSGRAEWIRKISWSKFGDLVVAHVISDLVGEVYIYRAPFIEKLSEGAPTVEGDMKDWNREKSAFTTFSYREMGKCDTVFSGYDLKSRKIFPDIPRILGYSPENIKIIPVDTNILHANWWVDNATIYLLITPLEYDEEKQDYKYLPTIAGQIKITTEGPTYATIAEKPNENIYLEIGSYELKSKPYKIEYCLGGSSS